VILLECFGENMINFSESGLEAQEAFINLFKKSVLFGHFKTRNLPKHIVCLLKKSRQNRDELQKSPQKTPQTIL
jgi:hypothetical protein